MYFLSLLIFPYPAAVTEAFGKCGGDLSRCIARACLEYEMISKLTNERARVCIFSVIISEECGFTNAHTHSCIYIL